MGIIEIIAIVLVVLWLGGFSLHIAGKFIHVLLIIALILFLLHIIGVGL
jgi:hypothetical protein